MRVILLNDVEKLGKRGEIKIVADGYARNFLIPKKMAVLASQEEIEELERQREIEAQKAEEELLKFQEIAGEIDGLELEMAVKVGEDNKLFGAISENQIAEKLKEKGFDVEKNQIKLENPIKEIGEYEVVVEFPHNLEAKIKIIVTEENQVKKQKEKET